MNELRELYQEYILDHNKHPRNFRAVPSANHHAHGYNPVCGDDVTVTLELRDGVIRDVGFEGAGCAISTAAASTMTEVVKDKSVREAEALFARYLDVVTGAVEPSLDELGALAVFAGVREFPIRVKCATLPWHTLRAALADDEREVTTE